MQAGNKLSAKSSGLGDQSLASTSPPAGQAGFRQEMAEGRPVVNLAGSVHRSVSSRDSFSFSRRGLRNVMNKLPMGKSRLNNVAEAVRPKNQEPRGEEGYVSGGGRGRLGSLTRSDRSRSGRGLMDGMGPSTEFMSLGSGDGGDGRGAGAWSSQGSGGPWPSRASSSPPPMPPPTNPLRSEAVQSAASKWLKRQNSSNAIISGASGASSGAGAGGGGGGVSATTSRRAARGVGLGVSGLGLGVGGQCDSGAASVASSSRDIMEVETAKTVAMVESGDFEEDSDRGGKVWREDGAAAASAGGEAGGAGGSAAAVAVVAVSASAAPPSGAATGNTSVVPADGPVPFHTLSMPASETASTPTEEEEDEGWGEGGGGGDLALVVAPPAVLTAVDKVVLAE